jgi:hypothetical protein
MAFLTNRSRHEKEEIVAALQCITDFRGVRLLDVVFNMVESIPKMFQLLSFHLKEQLGKTSQG